MRREVQAGEIGAPQPERAAQIVLDHRLEDLLHQHRALADEDPRRFRHAGQLEHAPRTVGARDGGVLARSHVLHRDHERERALLVGGVELLGVLLRASVALRRIQVLEEVRRREGELERARAARDRK
jgi:hypothetical protein